MNIIKSVASIFVSILLLVSPAVRSSDSLRNAKSPAPIPANITVPAGFKASVIADGLGGARHIAVAANGDVFVKLSRLKDGKGIIRLRDANKDDLYEQQSAFGDYPGTGIYVRSGYLYASSNTDVYRYKLDEKGEVLNIDEPELLVTGLVAKGRDESKSIVVDDKKNLYVTVGSYSNACLDAGSFLGPSPCPLLDSVGGVWKFRSDVPNQPFATSKRFATGLKNSVGIAWNSQTHSVFVTAHGRDEFNKFPDRFSEKMSKELPAETLYNLHQGSDAGWPYIYYDHIRKMQMQAPEYGGDGKTPAKQKFQNPVVAFPAHFAPNGLLFYTGNQFPPKYKNGAFIAFHGFSPEKNKGFLVAFVPFKNGKPSGNWEIFADNFGADEGQPSKNGVHRPCGLAQGPDGSLFVTDDIKGRVYRIEYR
jgi:glucose/arabinose dehydrogenase